MKNLLFYFTFFHFVILGGNRPKDNFNINNKISFKENKGQVSDQYYKPRPDVLFSGMANGMAYHLKNNGISYQLSKVLTWKEKEESQNLKPTNKVKESQKVPDQISIYRLDIEWLNCNKNTVIQKGKAFPGYENYYLEVCPNGATNVKSYEDITYQNIYSGIDLYYYSKNGNLKYDYIVQPNTDYKQIQLQIKGSEKLIVNQKGELVITTPYGEIIEQSPLVKQNEKTLPAKWQIKGNIVSFEIQNYNSSQPLIIDPLVRLWGTFYGGNGVEYGYSSSIDKSDNIYLAGSTSSSSGTVIATIGGYQTIYGTNGDAMLIKLDKNGLRIWSTYYGGSNGEWAVSCNTDLNNNIFFAGQTTSTTGISSTGSHQQVFGGGTWDAFLAKFDSNGFRKWATYYGGYGDDYTGSITTDSQGAIYLCGQTAVSGASVSSGTTIATPSSHQPSFALGAISDGYLVKFDSLGTRIWGTYYGASNGSENGTFCKTDSYDNVFFGGTTTAPTTSVISTNGSAFGGDIDIFLSEFNSNGVRQWGTYFGGIKREFLFSLDFDSKKNIYAIGYTTGTGIPAFGTYQTTFGGGSDDALLVKFDSLGTFKWTTYYGGNGSDIARSCFIDSNDFIYVCGSSDSNSGSAIASPGTYQNSNGGIGDAFMAKFDTLSNRQWGTYYGDAGWDHAYSIFEDSNSDLYIAGYTSSSTTVIATSSSYQPTNGGGYDAFLAKFNFCLPPSSPVNTTPSTNLNICAGNSTTLNATGSGVINWYPTSTSSLVLASGISYLTPTLSPGIYNYYVEASTCTVSITRTPITLTVNPNPTVSAITNSSLICVGQSATLSASGASTYSWSTASAGSSIVVSPTTTTTYTVAGTDVNGCLNNTIVTQSVSACTGLNELDTDNGITLFPNPTSGEFVITLNSVSEKMHIEIYNSLGQLIKKEPLINVQTKINLNEYSNGVYFLKVINNNALFYKTKVIKQ